jgi:transcriptional regulator with XRE-family HTH domain
MDEREQQLVEAAMRYVELLEQGTLVNIQEYVQTVDVTLRDDLAEDLELLLALGRPTEPIILTPEAQDRVDRALMRAQVRDAQRVLVTAAPSLTALRKARGMTVAALARVVDLPVDLMARIERGGVRAASVPPLLLERLGAALSAAEADIARALAAPTGSSAVRLSAQDGTTVPQEDVIDFVDALAASGATATQWALWT